ncbi:whey acidic -like [Pelobates cultripes]|uniref:Whey acidic -like n=1 Tax=Pelobates cultripes TaxID=61616 RepID=A0AAD1RST8_PELCU|nr:whey acidic -like [Pelobates cultripes]
MISASLIALGLSLCFLGARATDPAEKPGICPLDVDYPRCDSKQCLLPLKAKLDPCPSYDPSICARIRLSPGNCHMDNQCQGTERCCFYCVDYYCGRIVIGESGSMLPPVDH